MCSFGVSYYIVVLVLLLKPFVCNLWFSPPGAHPQVFKQVFCINSNIILLPTSVWNEGFFSLNWKSWSSLQAPCLFHFLHWSLLSSTSLADPVSNLNLGDCEKSYKIHSLFNLRIIKYIYLNREILLLPRGKNTII